MIIRNNYSIVNSGVKREETIVLFFCDSLIILLGHFSEKNRQITTKANYNLGK